MARLCVVILKESTSITSIISITTVLVCIPLSSQMDQFTDSQPPGCGDLITGSDFPRQPLLFGVAALQPQNILDKNHTPSLLASPTMVRTTTPTQHILSASFTLLGPHSSHAPFPFRSFDLTGGIAPSQLQNMNMVLVEYDTTPPEPFADTQPYRASVHPLGPLGSPPSREEWNTNKSTIKRLYLDEDNALHVVKEIMSKEFDFHAT